MSERTNSQIIHEARGLCWHDWVWYPREENSPNRKCYCRVCNEQAQGISINGYMLRCPDSPDYTDPTSYLEAMAWAQEQEWWEDFVLNGMRTKIYNDEYSDTFENVVVQAIGLILNPKLGSHALAEFLEGREG